MKKLLSIVLILLSVSCFAQQKEIDKDSLAIAQKWNTKIQFYLDQQQLRAEFLVRNDSLFNRWQGGIFTLAQLRDEELKEHKMKKTKEAEK